MTVLAARPANDDEPRPGTTSRRGSLYASDAVVSPATAIAVGGAHSCAIQAGTSAVVCWGDDTDGQASPPTNAFVQVTAGVDFTCGRKVNGAVLCWGDNASGQTGAPTFAFSTVSSGTGHTCGIRTDGTVTCWGVTFAADSNVFYATLRTAGTTYLVTGDVAGTEAEQFLEETG